MSHVKFLDIPERDRATIFEQTSNVKSVPSFAVEKDWWVVQALTAVDQDPRIIEIYYPNVIKPKGYLEPKIQVELGCRSLRDPFTDKTFTSFVDEAFDDRYFTQHALSVPSVNPERTFLEKVFLLHEEFQKPIAKIRVDRLSRHLYDVYHLSKTPYADDALENQDLYEAIVHHRHEFTRIGGVNYNYHNPQTINPIPLTEVIGEWKADYGKMLEEMIYEPEAPNFEEIIEGLTTLGSKINSLTWRVKATYPDPNPIK
ncbi:nucleotidyl transferase AbiEii/AbiGii toxin family protein [Parapedobacter sp. GCM10030251]|uniref:nucleotidyl transferase AbiEii/AbiGii toxin family protein n=1 Tax=Parapedobacter sp. GCM10030251 TaxID=3273419 RepID=UPI0036185F9C